MQSSYRLCRLNIVVGVIAVVLMGAVWLVPAAASQPQLPQCMTHAFRIRETHDSMGAGGSFFLGLSFRNITPYACRTGGFPGVTLLGRHRHRLAIATRQGQKIPRLVVQPGRRIYGVIQYSENPQTGTRCPVVRAVRIIAPNSSQRSLVHLPHGSWVCLPPGVDPLARSVRGSHNDG